MVLSATRFARHVGQAFLRAADRQRIERLAIRDAGHGYDALGLQPDWVALGLVGARWFYDSYFRVTSSGHEHLPASGAAILAANHSGMLPIDAAMLHVDVLLRSDPPRIARPVVDVFVPKLPFVSVFFSRVGAINGDRATVRSLLEAGDMVAIFPEGTPGIGKHFRDRYQLQTWRVGHAELAMRHGVPIIPVGIVGAEEQWLQVARIASLHPFGAPFLPVPAVPLPLPVHYRIYYGAPVQVGARYRSEQADDPVLVDELALEVKARVQALLHRGLRERHGVFL